jgi:hypothetical protein
VPVASEWLAKPGPDPESAASQSVHRHRDRHRDGVLALAAAAAAVASQLTQTPWSSYIPDNLIAPYSNLRVAGLLTRRI